MKEPKPFKTDERSLPSGGLFIFLTLGLLLLQLSEHLKGEGLGIFLISHDIHDVFDLADRVTVMKNGRSVATLLFFAREERPQDAALVTLLTQAHQTPQRVRREPCPKPHP